MLKVLPFVVAFRGTSYKTLHNIRALPLSKTQQQSIQQQQQEQQQGIRSSRCYATLVGFPAPNCVFNLTI